MKANKRVIDESSRESLKLQVQTNKQTIIFFNFINPLLVLLFSHVCDAVSMFIFLTCPVLKVVFNPGSFLSADYSLQCCLNRNGHLISKLPSCKDCCSFQATSKFKYQEKCASENAIKLFTHITQNSLFFVRFCFTFSFLIFPCIVLLSSVDAPLKT